MALVTWNDSFSVNIAQIDKQHKKLVDMINELHAAMKTGQGKDVMGKVLNGLVSYTTTHFETEEKLFREHDYPDAAAHQMEHRAFVAQVMDFKNGFDSGKLTVSVKVMNFLAKWIQDHIQGSDKQYAGFLNEKGVS